MLNRLFLFLSALLLCSLSASAQFDFSPNQADGARYIGGPRLGKSQSQIYRAGIIISPGPAMENVQISIPVPLQWYEQRIVNINEESMNAGWASRIQYRTINSGMQEMLLQLGSIRPTEPLEIVVAFELLNYELLPPDYPEQYVIPKKLPADIRQYLQPSPCIESREPVFSSMFAEITKGRNTDWDKVEALYSYVQNNVRYNDQAWSEPAKGALALTKQSKGRWTADCKDMTCLFVALCRAGKIPARVVRVPQHCYAEFYLEMKQEKRGNSRNNNPPPGFWFPCQVSGDYAFGGIPEKRIILQKGDAFPDVNNPKNKVLFPAESLKGRKLTGSGDVHFEWVHDIVVK